jgi:hypothetical protein
MRFSIRLSTSKDTRALVLEDAPRPTRIGYIKGVLDGFVGSQSYGKRPEPLDAHDTHKAFIALIRDEADPWDYDSESSWAALTAHLKDCQWPEFYDFVELVGALLLTKESEDPFSNTEYFKAYQAKVNTLLQEDSVGWSLNDKSELHRQIPKLLSERISKTESDLSARFTNARVHYQKAVSYLYQHPIDEANSIKEIVSALESVARTLVPKASTLGAAVKVMRKDARYSSYLLDALEKLYIYSNATPLVRHGHTEAGQPLLAEAELSLFIGVGYIRYLIEVGSKGA